MSTTVRTLVPLLCLTVSSANAAIWPGAAPCDTTLQACIDAQAAGGEVVIDSNGPIDESLTIGASLSLRGGPGREPVFVAGRNITASASVATPFVVHVSRLALRDAQLLLAQDGTGGASFEIEDVRVDSSSASNAAGIQVRFSQDGADARSVRVLRNRLRVAAPGLFDAGINLRLRGQAVDVEGRWNSVESVGESQGWGLVADVSSGATVDALFHANEVRGHFLRAGIGVSEGLLSSTPSTVTARVVSNAVVGGDGRQGGGIMTVVYNGSVDAQLINNTVTQSGFGLSLVPWGGGAPATGTLTGRVFNNLVAFNRRGISVNPSILGVVENDYNLQHANSGATATLPAGANDVVGDPQLVSIEAPRLKATSPARNAGTGLALLVVPDATLHDADGLRRLVDGVDIGAYEFGHRSLLVEKDSAAAESFVGVQDSAINADPDLLLFPTVNFEVGGVLNVHPLGVFSLFDQWWVRNANGSNMTQGVTFNLFAADGSDSTGVRRHDATGGNTLDGASVVDWAQTNGEPDRILLLTQATAFGLAAHPGPVALAYGGDRWQVTTTDGSNLVTGTVWNLYSQAPSPNAFRHTVTGAGNSSALDHPLLNGHPCAQVHVTPIAPTGPGSTLFDVFYTGDRWNLFSGSGLAAGQAFNVLVIPEQVEACTTGFLFRDGFEALNF